jgi:hypothetical protein
MGEKDDLDKEPKFIQAIEELLNSLISFLLNFPVATFKVLFHPSEIFEKKIKIKSLTYFSICLLLSSAFWYYYFLPDESFISPIVIYLLHPNLSEIKDYFFNTDSLTKALISLIPIVLITNIAVRLIALIFKVYDKLSEFLQLLFYLLGLILIGTPLLFFLFFLIIPKLFFHFFKYDIFASSLYEVISWIFFGTFLILAIRIIWVAGTHFFKRNKRHWYLKPILCSLSIIVFCYYHLRMVSFFYTEKKPDIESEITVLESNAQLTDTSSNYTMVIGVVITNKSENDQAIKLSTFQLSIGQENRYEITTEASFNEINSSSEQLNEIFILKGHSAIFFKMPFHFASDQCKVLCDYLKDQYVNDSTFTEGAINIKLEPMYNNFAKIGIAELKDKTEMDIENAE